MDTFDQLQLFDKLRKIIPKNVLEWSCQDTIKFLQFANLGVYETSFSKKQVDGKKMIKSYSTYSYEKFKDKTDVTSLLHYQKFIIWAHILKENYERFLSSINTRMQLIDQNKLSPRQSSNQRIILKSSNSIVLSPNTSQQANNGSSNNVNTSTPQKSIGNKLNQKTEFDFIEENSISVDSSTKMNASNSSQQSNQQQGQQSNLDKFSITMSSRQQNSEINLSSSNSQMRSSQQSNSSNTSINGSTNLGQFLQLDSNEIYKKLTENFVSFDSYQKLMEQIEESKGNKKSLQFKSRCSTRCIKTTQRQKKKMTELIEKQSSEKCFLMWNTRMVHQLLQQIQFNSLLPLVELWGLDGFIIQLIIPLYSLRQIELAFECKHEDVEKLFWLSDIFSAIKYTEQYSILNTSLRTTRTSANEDPHNLSFSSTSSQNESLKNKEIILHQQIQSFMSTNNSNLNSSLTLCVPIKKLSIDTLDSSDQSASQNLEKQMAYENGQKKEKWQHNSSNLSHQAQQKQEQNSFMISNQASGQCGRKGSEEFTVATMANLHTSQKTQNVNSDTKQIEIEAQIVQDLTPVNNNNNINPEFAESIFIPECLLQNSKIEKKKRISINFNKQDNLKKEKGVKEPIIQDVSDSVEIVTFPNQETQFAESTILNQKEPETFNVCFDPTRAQSQSVSYFNPLLQAKNSILQPIEEKDKSAESQSLADSMMNSNRMSTIPSVTNPDKKFFDSGVFANMQMQQTIQKNADEELGQSTLIDMRNQPSLQESVILTNQQNTLNRNQNSINNTISQDQSNQQKLFMNYDNYPTPKNIQNAFADSVLLDSTNSFQQQNIKNPQRFEDSNPLPKSLPSFQSQQTASIAPTIIQFQESTLLTPQTTKSNNFNEFCDSVLLQPSTQQQFQKNLQQNQNKQQEFQESVIFTPNTQITNNNTQFQDSVTFPLQSNNQAIKNRASIIAQNNQNQQFQESVLMEPQSKQIKQKASQAQQFQDSVIINPIRPREQFEESVLIQQSPPQNKKVEEQFAESTFVNNYTPIKQQNNQFQESTLINPVQPRGSSVLQESTLINPFQNNAQLVRQERGTSELQESTIINPFQNNVQQVRQTRGISELQESTLINPIQNQNKAQFQESTLINPVQNQKPRGESQFQESSLLFNNQNGQSKLNNQFQESTLMSSPPQKQANSAKQSFVTERNFRQSVVRNVNGDIDFNQSVIFNNQIFYNQKTQNKNNQGNNGNLEEPPSPVSKISSISTNDTQIQNSNRISKSNQGSTLQYEDRLTQKIFNYKLSKSVKSQEYQNLMKSLVSKTPILPFNPFDMMPLKKQYSMKIRIKSPDGSLYIDQNISVEGATIGRKPDNSIHFPKDNMISSFHAEIFFDNLSFYLRDLGSKQGTFIKMKEITLKKNMLIQLSVSYEIKILDFDEQSGLIVIGIKKNQVMKSHQYTMHENQQLKFGRDKEKCDIEIKEWSISSEHAKIVYSQKKFTMYDEGSLNGIWLRMSPKGEISEPFLITPDFSFRIYLISIQVIKLTQPKSILK